MDGAEPLDSTIVHPEKYDVVKSLISIIYSSINLTATDDNNNNNNESTITSTTSKRENNNSQVNYLNNDTIRNLLFSQQLRNYFESPSCNWNIYSTMLNEDVENLKLLSKWISDPYYNTTNQLDIRSVKGIPPKLTRRCILSPNDFYVGMMVSGVVRNITTFGVFFDIGSKEDALLHRSKYGNKQEFVMGEVLQCYIIDINELKGGKISLSLLQSDCPKQDRNNSNNDVVNQNQNIPRITQQQLQQKYEEYQSDDESKVMKSKNVTELTTNSSKNQRTQKKRSVETVVTEESEKKKTKRTKKVDKNIGDAPSSS